MTTMTNFKLPRNAALTAALTVSLASLSCGGGGAAPPSAYVSSSLGSGSTGSCNLAVPDDTPFVDIGSLGDNGSVPNGGNYDGSAVSVQCQVASTGTDSYDVNATITEGTIGGFQFQGTLTSAVGEQGPFTAAFHSGPDNYASTACTVTLQGGATPSNPSITAGRVWATLSCPAITSKENNDTCAGSATFILQNCDD
jgi:hypothetical protein